MVLGQIQGVGCGTVERQSTMGIWVSQKADFHTWMQERRQRSLNPSGL